MQTKRGRSFAARVATFSLAWTALPDLLDMPTCFAYLPSNQKLK